MIDWFGVGSWLIVGVSFILLLLVVMVRMVEVLNFFDWVLYVGVLVVMCLNYVLLFV